MSVDVSIQPGSRAFICGQSGAGKTTFAMALCEGMPSPLIVLDTKYDPGISAWAKRLGIPIEKKRMPDWKQIKHDVVVRPPPDWITHPEDIDWWLGQAFTCKYIPSIFIDEGYQAGASSSRMGDGVTGLWTRGRAFGMRLLLGTQRPAWISRFVLTESDVNFIGFLAHPDDRKTLFGTTGAKETLTPVPRHHFLFTKSDGSKAVLLKPLAVKRPVIYNRDNRADTRRRMKRS